VRPDDRFGIFYDALRELGIAGGSLMLFQNLIMLSLIGCMWGCFEGLSVALLAVSKGCLAAGHYPNFLRELH
jgi:hypothetical protein